MLNDKRGLNTPVQTLLNQIEILARATEAIGHEIEQKRGELSKAKTTLAKVTNERKLAEVAEREERLVLVNESLRQHQEFIRRLCEVPA